MNIFEVKRIKILHSEEDVNEYLKNGWILFRVFSEDQFILVSFDLK